MPDIEDLFLGFFAMVMIPIWVPAVVGLIILRSVGKLLKKLE